MESNLKRGQEVQGFTVEAVNKIEKINQCLEKYFLKSCDGLYSGLDIAPCAFR